MSPRLFIAVLIFTASGLFFAFILNVFNVITLSSALPAKIFNKPAIEVKKFFTAIGEIKTLREENQNLSNETTRLKKDLAIQSEIIEKHQEIAEQIEKAKALQINNTIPATVISRSPNKILDSVIIDAGSSKGVGVDDAALVDGFLIGIVVEVSPFSSKVELLTNPKTLIPVRLVSSRARGLLQGSLQGIEVNSIPSNIATKDKELVLSDSQDPAVMPGLPIGELSDKISAESEILKTFLIKSPVNFNTFEFLVIIPTNAQTEN